MRKYRIVEYNFETLRKPTFYIERKSFFKWNQIVEKIDNESKLIEFNSYKEAKEYLFTNLLMQRYRVDETCGIFYCHYISYGYC